MKMRKPVYAAAGFNTISLGPGRSEFHPAKPRPVIDHYIREAGQGVLGQISDPNIVDEGVIGNFMAARFNKQGNMAALMPTIHPSLEYKPHTRVEGACGSGGLALMTAVKSVLSDLSDVVITLGVEAQNTVKPLYGADYLALAGWRGHRKDGFAFFFPGKFSDRAGAAYEKYGYDLVRKAMATWYQQMILRARKNPKAQEYHNQVEDLFARGMTKPSAKQFLPNINPFDCSKVSDGASALLFLSEEGLQRSGIPRDQAVQVIGFGTAVSDLTKHPPDLTRMTTVQRAAEKAFESTGLSIDQIGTLEIHDCFTIGGLLELEAVGLAKTGKTFEYVLNGGLEADAPVAVNPTGGLIGFGHYTGGTGVRQAVDTVHQLIGQAGDCQVTLSSDRPYGMLISMGGDDRTVVAMIFRK